MSSDSSSNTGFLGRHEFLLRRLHSLSGLIPVGAYMVVHLMTNFLVVDGPATFQKQVYWIHSLPLLPVIEWTFIFIPILFHGILGLVIIRGGLPNTTTYTYASNVRYTLQRATGMIAFVFIMWHIFHMHGWFHTEWWINNVARPLGGFQFKPFNATSSAGTALQVSILVQVLYAIGVLASVFHLANGIWTFGITWGIWTSAKAQRGATVACLVFGVGLGVLGMAALWRLSTVDTQAAKEREMQILEAKIASGEIDQHEAEHKSYKGDKKHEPDQPKSVSHRDESAEGPAAKGERGASTSKSPSESPPLP